MVKINFRSLIPGLTITFLFISIECNRNHSSNGKSLVSATTTDSTAKNRINDDYLPNDTLLILPGNPAPEVPFCILAAGKEDILNAKILVSGPSGSIKSLRSKSGEQLPFWRIDDFPGSEAGKYKVALIIDEEVVSNTEFLIAQHEVPFQSDKVWKTMHDWNSSVELIYSVWINALFNGCNEQASWSALHEVSRNQDQNFLYNYLSLGEDEAGKKNSLIMQPDCADNPFFLRAYFAWKLGLPFGYHVCDRGYLGHNPNTGQWITNETQSIKTHPADAFNAFLRKMKDGIHSGTARTALDDENSDYYPVPLEQGALRPGTVFADPYGHTLVITGLKPQTSEHPGLLLAVDAQPDGTVGIKRFWKGNFLFNTSGVVGEPGFKAFRPIRLNKEVSHALENNEITEKAGFVPFSLQQRKMESAVFYNTMERLINPKPLDPETELPGLIEALHEQLIVRITSVANGEAYFKSNPGAVISMPSSAAGIFLTGGLWEDFSTPNRDLRLLIAMDEVLNYPHIKDLQSVFARKSNELSISYIRSDGSLQKLTVGEILKRRDAFEMAYNPNDGPEIRWGAPENSEEWAICKRRAPASQVEKMRSVRTWFNKRLHPPT